jgi:fucose permease
MVILTPHPEHIMNRTLFPHFFAFLLTGGLLAFPGACLDLILRDFSWSPGLFGTAMMLQGGASFVGSRFASQRSGGDHYRSWVVRSLWFLSVGVVFYYFADWTTLPLAKLMGMSDGHLTFVRLVGICLIGFGIGCNGILNNTAALVSENPSFALNLLNMGFTAGAVLLPLSASQYLQIPGLTEGSLAWRLPPAVLIAAYALLSLHVLRSPDLSQPTQVAADSESVDRWKLPLPVLATSLVLFCYVGSEINLSNSLGLMSETMFGFSSNDSRIASSIFWGGLLGARLYFCFRSPSAKIYPKIMLGLSFVCVVLFASLLLRAFAIGNSALFLSRVFILALGVCIGGMYSLSLGALTEFFDSSRSRYFANITVLSGVAGAVLLPFTFGLISNQIGLNSATVFILVLLTGMFTGAGLLFYASRRERIISHSL